MYSLEVIEEVKEDGDGEDEAELGEEKVEGEQLEQPLLLSLNALNGISTY